VPVAEAGVDGPRPAPLADELRVEGGIHLYQQAAPLPRLLQVQRVGRRLAVKRTALHEEPSGLITSRTRKTSRTSLSSLLSLHFVLTWTWVGLGPKILTFVWFGLGSMLLFYFIMTAQKSEVEVDDHAPSAKNAMVHSHSR